MKKIIMLILLLFCCRSGQAQSDSTLIDINNADLETINSLQLPPISKFIAGIDENPKVKLYLYQVDVQEQQLKTEKRSWLNHFRLSGNGQYGITNDLTVYNELYNPEISRYFGKTQFYYGAGVTFAVPFSEFIGKSSRIKRQKAVVNASRCEVEAWKDEIALQVIDSYTAAQENLNILKVMSNTLIIAKAQYKVTEADFIAGRADAQTLSRQKNIQTQTTVDFERARSALTNALMKLERLTKIKLLL